ncbi:MAG: M20/M25/M40 family metallo-hydrolase [Sphingobacteriia bacterium]|nr:M20/M25/M40 family metallo-hydrolase [Sphingobacteriia bacterium]
MKKLLLLFCFYGSIGALNAQTLTAEEQKIVLQTEKNFPQMMELLKASVNINSGTFNIQGVKQVGELYAAELRKLGFSIEWVGLPDSLKRAGHLVAYRKGKKGKKLFLIGHLDTVFEPDMPANPFTQLSDTTITGQGINDMKGGDVIIIAAMKALHELNLLNDATVTIYMTGDEENAGEPREVSRGDFITRAKAHDIALGFEGANGLNSIATARRGSSGWQLEVEGKQGHSSGVFTGAGYGSIYEASRIINTFRETLGKEKYLSFNPGLFMGGSEIDVNLEAQKGSASGKTNIISPKTVVIGDLRFLSEEQKNNARKTMQQITAQSLPGTKARIRFEDGIPAMAPTSGNEALAEELSKTNLALGFGKVTPGNPGSRGAGDISYIAAYLDCLDGFGASGKGAHAPGEVLNVKEFPKLMKRAAVFIYRLTR